MVPELAGYEYPDDLILFQGPNYGVYYSRVEMKISLRCVPHFIRLVNIPASQSLAELANFIKYAVR